MKTEVQNIFEDLKASVNGKVLLAVSGGRDSMTLWYLFRKFKIPHAVAHVNYGLRGKESDGDQQLVERTAKEFNVDLFVKEVPKGHFKKISGIQEEAREIRYSWFKELMEEHQISRLCTAHHLDDSVETFLMNFNRGAGLKGLGGIRSTHEVLRPLLPFSRKEISKYAKKQKIEYRDDHTNDKVDYLRNWFRKKIVKKWKKKQPSFLKNAAKSIENLKRSQELLDYLIQKELDVLHLSSQLPLEFPLSDHRSAELQKEMLFFLANKYEFNRDQIDDLFQAYQNQNVGAMISSSSHRILLDRDKFIISEKENELDMGSIQISKEGIEIDEPFFLSVDSIQIDQIEKGIEKVEYLDISKIEFPLELRKWEEGDRMQPLGMKGKKKVSDILIDAKTPLTQKESVYVLRSKQEIVCLIGYRISDKFKLTKESKEILRIRW